MKKVFNKIGSYTRFFDEFSSSLLLQRNTIVSIVFLFLFFSSSFSQQFRARESIRKIPRFILYYCVHNTTMHPYYNIAQNFSTV